MTVTPRYVSLRRAVGVDSQAHPSGADGAHLHHLPHGRVDVIPRESDSHPVQLHGAAVLRAHPEVRGATIASSRVDACEACEADVRLIDQLQIEISIRTQLDAHPVRIWWESGNKPNHSLGNGERNRTGAGGAGRGRPGREGGEGRGEGGGREQRRGRRGGTRRRRRGRAGGRGETWR